MIAETIHRPAMRAPLASLGEMVFLGSVVLQGLHFVEHISQVAQKFFLGVPQASGILGATVDFDLVWIHFTINLLVMAPMLVALMGMTARLAGPSQTKGP